MIEKNVQVVVSTGVECFVCEHNITPNEKSIRVAFNVDLILTTTQVRKEMHIACAYELYVILGKRINQAKGGKANGR